MWVCVYAHGYRFTRSSLALKLVFGFAGVCGLVLTVYLCEFVLMLLLLCVNVFYGRDIILFVELVIGVEKLLV